MNAVLCSQNGCGPCAFAARDLTEAGFEFETRNVRTDENAAQELIALYAAHRPGLVPTTPVAVIGSEVFFGPVELHQHIRLLARATIAA